MFIGYPRSGHTLLGSIIDAHPYATIAQEENVLLRIKQGKYTTRQQIVEKCIGNSAIWQGKRMWEGYSYKIPNQYNSQSSPMMTVVGDKKGGESTSQLMNNPTLLEKTKKILEPLSIKWIHGVRNPYDNIATWSIKRPNLGLDVCIREYFKRARFIQEFRRHNDVFDIYNDKLIVWPELHLTDLMNFLELDPDEYYLSCCASTVFTKPRKTRFNIKWTEEQIIRIYDECQDIDFLENYTMEN